MTPTLDGAGPIRFGMTSEEAVAALDQAHLAYRVGQGDCDYMRVRQGDHELQLMVEEGRVVRADITDSATSGPRGARIGLTEDSIRVLFSPNLLTRPHKYTSGRYLIHVSPEDSLRRVVFETDGSKVTAWRVGLFPQVEYVEGCS